MLCQKQGSQNSNCRSSISGENGKKYPSAYGPVANIHQLVHGYEKLLFCKRLTCSMSIGMPDLTCLLKSAAASFQDAMCDSNVFFGCMQARKPICQGRRGAVQGLLGRLTFTSNIVQLFAESPLPKLTFSDLLPVSLGPRMVPMMLSQTRPIDI